MKKNVNVFIGVLLCAVLCGTFVWLSSSGDESSWSPNDIYNEVQGTGSVGGYATTSATFSGSSNDGGVALPMSSSSMRARTSYKYAGAYSGAATMPLTSNLSPLTYGAASGAGLHLTSNAEIKSFGGGGNGGAAMSYSRSPIANSQSPIANVQSPISSRRLFTTSSSTTDMPSVAPTDEPMAAAAMASPVMYGSQMVGVYGEYTSMFGGAFGSYSGIRGRMNTGHGPTVEDSWLIWLSQHTSFGSQRDDVWYFSRDQLYAAWEEYCATWNETMGKKPTWDEWLAWFMGNDGSHSWESGGNIFNAHFVPVGNILPLLFIALLYVLFVAIKSQSSKSLSKTERSE